MSATGSGSPGAGKVRVLLLATAAAVGGLGVALVLYRQATGGGSDASGCVGPLYKRFVRGGAVSFPADSDPHRATQVALMAVRDGAVRSVGDLVCLLRGPADVVFAGQSMKNSYRIRAPAAFVQYITESYLPATQATSAAGGVNDSGVQPSERPMMTQLVKGNYALLRLERERATPFDSTNISHTNLLQQLWVAAGRPLNAYARTGAQWADLGFQGEDPTTDLRGAGVLGLRQFVRFAQRQPQALRQMIEFNKQAHASQSDSWYLIAVVSLQLSAQLLLQHDYCFYAPHLRVLYDTLVPTTGGGSAAAAAGGPSAAAGAGVSSSSSSGSSNVAKGIGREALQAQVAEKGHLTAQQAAVQCWTDGQYSNDVDAGLCQLHELLLLHFKTCWERDKPHVMSYNTYVAEKVFGTFFVSSWSPAS